MFSSGFVICLLKEGRPCQESRQGIVRLPFGTEYAVRLRNKNKRPAVATVWIDGENVSGSGYIVAAGGYCDIERHRDSPAKFRFASTGSEAAIDAGKNNATDDHNGLVEVRWRIEKEPEPKPILHWYIPQAPLDYGPIRKRGGPRDWSDARWLYELSNTSDAVSRSMSTMSLCAANEVVSKSMLNSESSSPDFSDEGCTVQGSYSSQRFTVGHIGELEPNEVIMRLVLKGEPRPRGIRANSVIVDEFVGKEAAEMMGLEGKIKLTTAAFCGECGHNRTMDAKPTKFCVCCGTKF